MVTQAHPLARRWRQRILLLFFGLAMVSLLILYVTVPALDVQTLLLTPRATDSHPVLVTVVLGLGLLFVSVLGVGVLPCWRWLFWGLLLAHGLSVVGIPATLRAVSGVLPLRMPLWDGVLRLGAPAVQVVLAVWLLRLDRRHGVWATGAARRRP